MLVITLMPCEGRWVSNKPKKLYPSSSAFMWGRIVHTAYGSGCLRNVLIKSRGVRTEIAKFHMVRGAKFEEMYEKRLQDSGISYQAEKKICVDIPGTEVLFSGRIDFLIDSDGSGDFSDIRELKSTESKAKRREVINKGYFVINQLAQLIAYMVSESRETGKLIVAYLEADEATGEYKQPEVKMYRGKPIEVEKTFEVQIHRSGRIIVDGKTTQWTAHDFLEWRQAAAEVIESGEVWERPNNYDAVFNSPCGLCEFRGTCDKWDAGEIDTTEDFVRSARDEVKTSKE